MKRWYCCRKHGEKICYKKTRLYCSTCSDKGRKFYYCHDFYRISLEKRTWFMEHQHCIDQRFCWLLCFSPFNTLLYLLNSFYACFLHVPLITTCNNPYFCSDWNVGLVIFFYCFNAFDDNPFIKLSFFTIFMPKKYITDGHDLMQKKTLHSYLNRFTCITNKLLVILEIFMFLPSNDYLYK